MLCKNCKYWTQPITNSTCQTCGKHFQSTPRRILCPECSEKSKRCEICGKLTDCSNTVLRYQAHVQDKGWLPWVGNGELAGTTLEWKRLECVRIKLEGEPPPGMSVVYQAYVQGKGWFPEVRDGAEAGTTGQSLRLEHIKIKLMGAPLGMGIRYKVYLENYGWQNWVYNGAEAGSSSVRTEGIIIELGRFWGLT